MVNLEECVNEQKKTNYVWPSTSTATLFISEKNPVIQFRGQSKQDYFDKGIRSDVQQIGWTSSTKVHKYKKIQFGLADPENSNLKYSGLAWRAESR